MYIEIYKYVYMTTEHRRAQAFNSLSNSTILTLEVAMKININIRLNIFKKYKKQDTLYLIITYQY